MARQQGRDTLPAGPAFQVFLAGSIDYNRLTKFDHMFLSLFSLFQISCYTLVKVQKNTQVLSILNIKKTVKMHIFCSPRPWPE